MLLMLLACAGTSFDDTADDIVDSAFTGDPSGDGPNVVTTTDTEIEGPTEPLVATTWAPSAPVGNVVMMPGFLATHDMYAPFAAHLASWGWRVVGFTFSANGMTDPADHEADAREAMAVIDTLDSGPVVTMGHSKGGKIAVLTAIRDARVDAVVAWDPVDAGGAPCAIDPEHCHDFSVAPNGYEGDVGEMSGLTVPFLLFGAPAGMANPEEHNADRFWEGAQSPATYVHFEAGTHTDWIGENDTSAITRRTEVPWLARELLGASGTEPWLTGEVIQADVDAGMITVESR
jgi:pimeloyl-ACP methyl ester carboxylesterase